jgi:AcrR family transcriptional regulator
VDPQLSAGTRPGSGVTSPAAEAGEPRRRYVSPLRENQVATTRERILDAFEELMLEGDDELSIPAVARRSGVAVRTIYRHFENRDALLAAFGERVTAQLFRDRSTDALFAGPTTYAEGLGPLFRRQAELRPLFDAAQRAGLFQERATEQAPQRQQLINAAFADAMAGLDPASARRLGAVLHVLGTRQAMQTMVDWWDLTPEDAAVASGWAILALADAAKRARAVDLAGDEHREDD